MATTRSKRKGEDNWLTTNTDMGDLEGRRDQREISAMNGSSGTLFQPNVRTYVVHSSPDRNTAWESVQRQLASLRDHQSEKQQDLDHALQNVLTRGALSFSNKVKAMEQHASDALQSLQKQWKRAQDAHYAHEMAVSSLRSQLLQRQEELQSIQRELEQTVHLEQNLSRDLETFLQDADLSLYQAEKERLDKQHQVPRLRHQISLYAACTGIKWNFEQEHVLEGEVSIPSKQLMRHFRFDSQEMSRFEIAQNLWALMEGDDACLLKQSR